MARASRKAWQTSARRIDLDATGLARRPPRQSHKRVAVEMRLGAVRLGERLAVERGAQRHGAHLVDHLCKREEWRAKLEVAIFLVIIRKHAKQEWS